MKSISQIYQVELNKDEIMTLTDALDSLFEFNRVAYEDAMESGRKDDEKYYYSLCSNYYTLRNQFAKLIGRTFEN